MEIGKKKKKRRGGREMERKRETVLKDRGSNLHCSSSLSLLYIQTSQTNATKCLN